MSICFHLSVLATALSLAALTAAQQPPAPAPVSVMIVGTFHMSNPGHDLHNAVVDDVLQPAPQAEIGRVTGALAAFHPTTVMAEWPADLTRERYAQFRAGTLPPSRNEVVQLGFGLAKKAGLPDVLGIDVDGDFPFEPVQAYAKAHGQSALLDKLFAEGEAQSQSQTSLLRSSGIAATLRSINQPAHIAGSNDFYRETLRVGHGTDQPGADLLTAWYSRNFRICANLIQNSHPGDRIVVFYGAGHAFLLRQCIAETPGFQLVEPNQFLPAAR